MDTEARSTPLTRCSRVSSTTSITSATGQSGWTCGSCCAPCRWCSPGKVPFDIGLTRKPLRSPFGPRAICFDSAGKPASGGMNVALAGLLMLGPCPALAFDNDRFTLSAGYDFGYDTNVFRLPAQAESPQPTPDGSRRGDQLSIAAIAARYRDQIGRQAFEAGIVEALYRYKTLDSLDHNAMASEVRWAGEIGDSWRPLLEWTRRKNLEGFADLRFPVRNIQTTD